MGTMPFLSGFNELHEIIGLAAVLCAAALALTFGTLPWRLAGLILLFDTFILGLLSGGLDRADRVPLVHGKAILIALLYAILVVRFRGTGLIALMALQGVAVLFHLSTWMDRSILSPINAMVLNGVGWTMLLVLVLGAVRSRTVTDP